MRGFAAALTISLVVPLSTLSAQQSPPVEIGDRVRVAHDCSSVRWYLHCRRDIGTLTTLTADSVVLRVVNELNRLAVSLELVNRVEVSRGRKSNVRKGIGYGFLVGAVGGMFAAANVDASCNTWCFGVGAIVVAVPSAFVGGIIGAFIKTDRWEEVPLDRLRVSFAPQRDGRFALGLSVAF